MGISHITADDTSIHLRCMDCIPPSCLSEWMTNGKQPTSHIGFIHSVAHLEP